MITQDCEGGLNPVKVANMVITLIIAICVGSALFYFIGRDNVMMITIVFLSVLAGYVALRVLSHAIFRSYFEVKNMFESHKSKEVGKDGKDE